MDDWRTIPWYRKIFSWVFAVLRDEEAQNITRELWSELWSDLENIFPCSLGVRMRELVEWAMCVAIGPNDESKNYQFSVSTYLKLRIDSPPAWENPTFYLPVAYALGHTSAHQLRVELRSQIRQRVLPEVKRRIAEVEKIINKLYAVIQASIREESGKERFELHDMEYHGLTKKQIRDREFGTLFFNFDQRIISNMEARYKLLVHRMRALKMIEPVAKRLRATVPSQSDKRARIWHQPDVYFLQPLVLEQILESCSSSELSVIEEILSSNGNPAQIWQSLLEHVRAGALRTRGSDGKGHGSVIGIGPGMHSPFRR